MLMELGEEEEEEGRGERRGDSVNCWKIWKEKWNRDWSLEFEFEFV